VYREITGKLSEWKSNANRKPLLVTGVRQCGKTYIIKKFAQENFKAFVYINFEESEQLSAIFDYDYDVKRIVHELELHFKSRIVPGDTCVFMDEIQECPRAITALKYFCENMRELHLICAGSLLGVAIRKKQISFPVGKVNRLELHPMDFREFVLANGRTDLIQVFEQWPVERPIPDLYSVQMKKLLSEYYIVGGMPEAVKTWIDSESIEDVEQVQNDILRDYADDFSKHAPESDIVKIRWIWDSIPVQLAKENRKFIFSHVKEGKRSADLEDALQWLVDAGLVARLHMVEEPESPLSGFADKTYFKVYMCDIGLLRVKSRVAAETILGEDPSYIRFKGAFAENYVFNELISAGKEPYFWRSGNTAEVDFIFENRSNLIPVEVKSADNTQAKSYKQFCEKYKPGIGFKLSQKNIAVNTLGETRTFSIPLYLTWNLERILNV